MTNPDTIAPVVESVPATFTQQQVLDALNEAANDILAAVHAGEVIARYADDSDVEVA